MCVGWKFSVGEDPEVAVSFSARGDAVVAGLKGGNEVGSSVGLSD